MFAVDDVQSFKAATQQWFSVTAARDDLPSTPTVLVGNKCDQTHKVTNSMAEAWLTRLAVTECAAPGRYMQVSALTGDGLVESFRALLELSGYISPPAINRKQSANVVGCKRSVCQVGLHESVPRRQKVSACLTVPPNASSNGSGPFSNAIKMIRSRSVRGRSRLDDDNLPKCPLTPGPQPHCSQRGYDSHAAVASPAVNRRSFIRRISFRNKLSQEDFVDESDCRIS